ncbi:hypothetical protein [Glaesserella parasuis]|uniref:hypothetical protein n=1 Tax=Glaesserella parasuis TaxID=738 RepID=UPI002436E157|nr:hypothetical protein [Glaesserella parasuis]MDG6319414.1 hypothetical protein [Glaesserella parasuis]
MQVKIKSIVVSLTTLVGALVLSSLYTPEEGVYKAVVPTIYTLSGIMFSIGMGIVCTFNPSAIKNPQIFKRVKENIANVRNSFLMYFSLATITFLISQIVHSHTLSAIELTIIFNPETVALLFSLISLIYFIINFLTIQKLIFDIAEKVMKEEQT